MKSSQKKSKSNKYVWSIKVFVLSFFLTAVISFFTQFSFNSANIIIVIAVIILLLAVSLLFDIIAVAVTAADIEPFNAMASQKIKGAKRAVYLVKNAHAVNSICSDMIGDVCGIISGMAGITASYIFIAPDDKYSFIAVILVSSVIASITIGCKALAKVFALKHSHKIVYLFARFLSIFSK